VLHLEDLAGVAVPLLQALAQGVVAVEDGEGQERGGLLRRPFEGGVLPQPGTPDSLGGSPRGVVLPTVVLSAFSASDSGPLALAALDP
jgi:hypothetical protein